MCAMAKKSLKSYVQLLILGALIFLPSVGICQKWTTDFEAYIYWIETGNTRTLAWDAVPDANSYDFYVLQMESGLKYLVGNTAQTQVPVTFRKVGHYLLYVRAKNEIDVSEYSSSLTEGVVNGIKKPWTVFARIAPPSGGGVGN